MINNPLTSRVPAGILAGLVLLALGCVGSSPSASFYLLEPVDVHGAADPDGGSFDDRVGLTLGVGPIHVADYLDRPQLVVRGQGQELLVDEYNRWAEPLGTSLTRVMTRSLATLLGTERVWSFPGKDRTRADLRVVMDIERFDADSSGVAVLEARWYLVDGATGESSEPTSFQAREACERASVGARVEAMNRALDSLARQVAGHLNALELP